MLYEKLRKSKFDPHPAMKTLYPLSVKKMSEYLKVDYGHLAKILAGQIKPGDRLERDIWKLVDELKT